MILIASLLSIGAIAVGCGACGTTRPTARAIEHREADGAGPRRQVRRWPVGAGIGVLGLAACAIEPMLAVVLVVILLARPRLRARRDARRRAAEIERTLPDAIELLTLVVHAGLTPAQAVDLLTRLAPEPIRPAFAEVVRRTRRGQALPDALRALPDVVGPGAAPLADTLAIAEREGAPIGATLDQLGHDARLRRRRRGEAIARRLPVRLSFPLVVCTLPSFVLVAIAPAVLAALSSLGDTAW